ncbi:MAG: TolC family protein [Oceanospirillales bacterium]|nr:TolC family protein [Oceanospirillales bacterium]
MSFNYERKLKTLESVLEKNQLEMSVYEQLPDMTAAAGYTVRDNYAASASTTFDDGVPAPLPSAPTYSISQDKQSLTSNIAFSWNILDFGLSYVRAKQQADKYLITKERERKVIHNISKEVRSAYYRAVSAQKLLSRVQPLMARASDALRASRQIEELRAESPLEALSYQRNLLEIVRTLQALRQELSTAKNELARLMGLMPDERFVLVEPDEADYVDQDVALDLQCMEKMALLYRPELMETRYRERISVADAKAALLKLLPGISFNAGYHYDGSDYLLNNEWASYGARVSWNLLNVFSLPAQKNMSELRQKLAKERTLATSMAVLSQVHMANINFAESRANYKIAEQYLQVSARIAEQTDNASKLQNIGELKLIREHLNQILAELRRDVAYATMQNYYGEIFTSVGLEVVGEEYKALDVNELQHRVSTQLANWKSNNFNEVQSCDAVQL